MRRDEVTSNRDIPCPARRAFTLVEILIVVVILGILAAIVIPQFTNATEESQRTATLDQLVKIRRAVEVYWVRNNAYPSIQAGDGTWGEIVDPNSKTYLRGIPPNAWVGGANAKRIEMRSTPDTGYTSAYGWIYSSATGQIWAASFDGNDAPFPKP